MSESTQNNEARNMASYGMAGAGFDLSRLDGITREEIDAHLQQWVDYTRERGIYYGLNALGMLVDHRPDIAKLAIMGGGGIPQGLLGHPARPVLQNVRNLAEYIRLGWESGIYNECRELQMRGQSKAEIMEIVMYANLSGGGIRSMGHVHNAMGKSLWDWRDGDGAVYPDGWAADPEAFKSGLDLSVGHMTEQDARNLEGWYETTIGWVPKSVRFGIKHNPRFLKTQRAKWEAVFKVLPKQVAPYLMVAQHTSTGFAEGLREGTLLARAWGLTPDWVMESVCGQAYYFRGHEALEVAYYAIGDIMENW
jgi:hypothetical protein